MDVRILIIITREGFATLQIGVASCFFAAPFCVADLPGAEWSVLSRPLDSQPGGPAPILMISLFDNPAPYPRELPFIEIRKSIRNTLEPY